MKETNSIEIQKKNEFALCSIMFFSPLIHYQLKKDNYWLSEDDKSFIMWYIKYWYLIIWILLLNFVLSIYNLLHNLNILHIIINIINILLVLLVLLWMILIFSNVYIFQKNTLILDFKKIRKWNLNILLEYLPILNYYFRYNKQKDIKSYWWLKESIIVTTFFILIWLFANSIFLIILFILFYIIRIATLFWWIDFVSDDFKEKLDNLFNKNPEEICGYVKWIVLFSLEKITNKWDVSDERKKYLISNSKLEYSWLHKMNKFNLFVEYFVYLVLLFVFFVLLKVPYLISSEIFWWLYLIPWILLLSRYLILIPQKKLPYVPFIHDIYVYINKLLKRDK